MDSGYAQSQGLPSDLESKVQQRAWRAHNLDLLVMASNLLAMASNLLYIDGLQPTSDGLQPTVPQLCLGPLVAFAVHLACCPRTPATPKK